MIFFSLLSLPTYLTHKEDHTITTTSQSNKQSNKKYPCIGTTDKKAKIILDWVYSSKCINLERKYNKYLENFN